MFFCYSDSKQVMYNSGYNSSEYTLFYCCYLLRWNPYYSKIKIISPIVYFNCHFGRFISKRWKEYCMKINFVIIINLVFTTYVCKNRTFFNPKEVICGPDHPVASGGRHIFHADTAHQCRTRHHQQSGADCYRVAHVGSARSGAAYHVSYPLVSLNNSK